MVRCFRGRLTRFVFSSESINVFVRVRPPLESEILAADSSEVCTLQLSSLCSECQPHSGCVS